MLEPLEAGMVLAEYAHKPGAPFAWHVRQVDYLIEMGNILGIENWYNWGASCFAHPLRLDRDVADKFARRTLEGSPVGFTQMPVGGVSTPITSAGFIVVSAAEQLATWICGRAINPKVELRGSMWGGAMDMATGSAKPLRHDLGLLLLLSLRQAPLGHARGHLQHRRLDHCLCKRHVELQGSQLFPELLELDEDLGLQGSCNVPFSIVEPPWLRRELAEQHHQSILCPNEATSPFASCLFRGHLCRYGYGSYL